MQGSPSNVISTAQALALTFSGMRELGILDRALYGNILQRILVQHPEYLGVWTVWEPNALDGRDREFAHAPGHDGTGRFVPLWNRAGGVVHLEPNVNYDVPGQGDWYLVPTQCGRETVMDPYQFPVAGRKEFIISQVAPIFHQGRCVGAAGVDIEMDRLLQPEAEELEESLHRGFVRLDARGRIDHLSARTRQLLSSFVGRRLVQEIPAGILRQIARVRGLPGTAELAPLRRGSDSLRLKHAPHPESGMSLLIVEEDHHARSGIEEPTDALTAREREVLQWLQEGKSNPEIGVILGISTHTVKRHVERVLAKLGVESRLAAALQSQPKKARGIGPPTYIETGSIAALSGMTSTTPAELTAIKEDLIAKGVKYCIGAYVDIHGVPKGKVVPVNHFENFAQGSELYTGYALDGLGQRPNDDELSSVPDLSRGVQLPWQPEVMWYPADLAFHGQPYEVSTRVAFGRVLEQARSMGFRFNLGIECEVYFVKQEEGRLVVPNPDDNLMKSCYDVKRFMDVYGLVDRIATTINGLGWDLYSLDHEDGNSQFEFDFKFSDGLTMADRYVFFRFLAKKLAADAGLLATFMPKPFADKTGNGAHFNMSLSDLETGRNLFKAATGEPDAYGLGLTSLGYSFIAGILRHGRALCAAFAPTVNSYKRLIRRGAMGYYSWAPVFNSFGTNNRTNSVRVPMAGGRCESRNADSSCNPYLAGALVLAAGLEGVREGLMPGHPQTENLYELTDEQLAERGVQALPRTLAEAVQAFEDDPFTEQVLGSALKKEFIECKRAEWEEYHLTISPWEVQKYASLF